MNKRCLPAVFCLSGLLIGCPGEHSVGPNEIAPSPVYCGDEKSRGSEICDGDDLEDQSCEDLGLGAGQLACKPDCRAYDVSACGAPNTCGNGAVDGVERCDESDLDGESCEGLGYGPGLLTCLSNCADFDTSACAPPPGCGDGEKTGSELCDGQDFGSLTCARLGLGEGELRCLPKCDGIDRSDCHPLVRDAGPDASRDATQDSGRDTGRDANVDASLDAGSDAGRDATIQDSRPNPDVAAADSGRDAGQEAGIDSGPSCPTAKDCSGRSCGPDPICGLSCGTCDGSCSSTGVCTPASYSCDQPEALRCGDIIDHAASTFANWLSGYPGCGLDNNFTGGEQVFAFTASGAEQVVFDLSGSSGGDLDLLILRPNCDAQSCAGSSTGTNSSERVSIAVSAGESLHVVVDGYRSAVGRFTLTVQCTPISPDAGLSDVAISDSQISDTTVGVEASTPDAGGGIDTADSGTVDTSPAEAATPDRSATTDAGAESGPPACIDRCSPVGSLSCSSNQSGVLACRDGDGDGCLEWVHQRTCGSNRTCVSGTCVSTCSGPTPCREEIVISEIHYDPAAVSDITGEYIELYNRSDHSVDLAGCTLSDDNSSLLLPTFVIPAGGFGLVGRSAVSAENGGINPDVLVSGNQLRLGNTTFETLTLDCGFVMDVVALSNGHPGGSGVSLQLDPGLMAQEKNDFATAWCDSTLSYGAGDLGTPGAANTPCMKSVIFFDDLETNAWTDPRWKRGGAGNVADQICNWEWGRPRSRGYYFAPPCMDGHGDQCLATDVDLWAWGSMSYSSNWVQLGPIDLSTVSFSSTVELIFWLYLDFKPNDVADHAQVVISSDGINFIPLDIGNLPYDDPSSAPTQWGQSIYGQRAATDLSAWIGEPTVYLRWQEETDVSLLGSGMQIDNVWIVER